MFSSFPHMEAEKRERLCIRLQSDYGIVILGSTVFQ